MIFARAPRRVALWVITACVGIAVVTGAARAQVGSDRYASMVIDEQTGQVISAANPDEYRFPASLTKMMTMYLTFEAIRAHRLAFNDLVPVSQWAASMPPTKLGLIPGSTITVEQALLGLVTKSANDAATALGEMLGGSEEQFAQIMTQRAHSLGMEHTTFRNANGLPDWGQVTTARDLVVLARHLIQDFPEYYHFFSTPSFVFHGRTVPNHQTLLRIYAGADGLKTGYTEASGYNVVTSAVRGDRRIIGVVLGAGNGCERDSHMTALLDQGFQRLGVAPVEVARREPYYPLMGSAHAATIRSVMAEAPPPPPLRGRRMGSRSVTMRRVAAFQPTRSNTVVSHAAPRRAPATWRPAAAITRGTRQTVNGRAAYRG